MNELIAITTTNDTITLIATFILLTLISIFLIIRIHRNMNGHRYKIKDCVNRLNQLECDDHAEMEVVMVATETKVGDIKTEKVYFTCPQCGREWYKLKRDLNPIERTAFFKFNHKNKTTSK